MKLLTLKNILTVTLLTLPLQLFAATGTLTPATHDYGSVTIGSVSTQIFTLTSAGAGTLAVTSVTASAAPFTKTADNCTGVTLTPPATCTVTIQYTPTAVSTSAGTLTIVTNATDGTQKISSLVGTGTTGPSVTASLTPTTYAYGSVTIGSSSATTFTITNTGGTANLTIASATVSAAPFIKTADNCTGASLPLAGTCTIEVTYLPTAAVLSNALLTVVTNATDGTSKIATLSGTGVTGTSVTASMTPASYSYGNVTIGSTSTATFTIENTGGNTNLTITSAAVGAAPFVKTADNCTGASLPLAGTCTIEVSYIPTAAALSNSILTVVTNATNGTTKISSLSGVGVTGPTVTGSITSASHNYGSVTIGSASTATFTIENTGGSVNLNITSATVSAAPFTKTADTCTGASLPLAGTCTIEVTYFPTAATVSLGTLTVLTNATDGTSKIASLIGTGITGPSVTATITPSTYSYGSVSVGTLSSTTFTIENTGGTANLNIASATASAAPFIKTADNCTGASLAFGETCTVEVSYFPTTATSSAGILTVLTNATNGTSKIASLTGTGVNSGSVTGSITPTTYQFPDVDVGSTGSQTFTVENTGGSGNLNISTVTVTAASPFWANSDTCSGASLAFGATCTIDVVFSPTVAGVFVGTLTVVTNAGNGTNKIVSLNGTTSAPGTITFSSSAYAFNNNIGDVILYVTRTGGSAGAVSVDYTTSPGSASDPAGDYDDETGTLSWIDGDSAPKQISIKVYKKVFSGTRTFSIILSENSGDATLGNNVATVKLTSYTKATSSSSTLTGVNEGDAPVLDSSGCSSTGSSLWSMLLLVIGILSIRRFRLFRRES